MQNKSGKKNEKYPAHTHSLDMDYISGLPCLSVVIISEAAVKNLFLFTLFLPTLSVVNSSSYCSSPQRGEQQCVFLLTFWTLVHLITLCLQHTDVFVKTMIVYFICFGFIIRVIVLWDCLHLN